MCMRSQLRPPPISVVGSSLEKERDTLNLSFSTPRRAAYLPSTGTGTIHSLASSRKLPAQPHFFQLGEGRGETCRVLPISTNFSPKRCLPRCHNHHIRITASKHPTVSSKPRIFLQAPPPPRGRAGSFGLSSWVLRTGKSLWLPLLPLIRIDESEAAIFPLSMQSSFFLPACPFAWTMKFQSIRLRDVLVS